MSENKDFLRNIVQKDLKDGKYKNIVTRFPPEPNGFPHIGHAKSICINFGIAKDFNGICNLRMDDTNPTTEDTKYVEALKDAVTWLGFDFNNKVFYTSDYFDKLYDYAVELIKMGKAYVDSLNDEEISEYRGSLKVAGKRSVYASRTIEENLDLFHKMKQGEFKNGEHILRAKIDMSSPNMKLRDPLLYRIRHSHHFRTGDKWCIYPMYDFAHCLSDYIEGVTHSICTLEFENNRVIYDWILDTLGLKTRPYQYEFARLGLNYTVMSKRKLLEIVQGGYVSNWDDPRMPTIAGYKRRGYTKESILNFCEQIGVAKANSTVDVSQLEFCIRDDLNKKAPRVLAVLNPLKVTIINYEKKNEELEAPYYPHDIPKDGSRVVPFSKEIFIEKDDFSLNAQKDFYRLTPTQPVRLRHGYIIECVEVVRDENEEVVEIKARYYENSKSNSDTSGIKVKSAIQWVSAKSAVKAEVRLYDRLYKNEAPQGLEDLNLNSLEIIKNALVEPAVIESAEERFQFERHGYFYKDPVDYTKGNPVFNKIVGLKDSWTKKQEDKPKTIIIQKEKKTEIKGEEKPLNKTQEKLFCKYKEYGLNDEISNILAKDEKLSNFYEESLKKLNSPINLANIIANDVAKELKHTNTLNFTTNHIVQLVKLIDEEKISSKIAKQVFEEMTKSGKEPEKIVEEKELLQISDEKVLQNIIDEVLKNNSSNLQKYKDGNQKLFGFFVGEVLKATNGKANPRLSNEILTKALQN